MKSVFGAIAVLAFCGLSVYAADANHEAEMKGQLAGLAAAFNKGDGKGVAEFFTTDATMINPQGVKAVGRDKIAEIIQTDLSAVLKSGKSDFKLGGMRILGPDLAFVDSTHEIAIKPPTPGMQIPPMRIQFSGVAKKIAGKWLWLDARPYAMMPGMMGGKPAMMPPNGMGPQGMVPPGMGPQGMPPGMNGVGKIGPPPGGPSTAMPPPGSMPPGMKANPPPPPAAAGQVPKGK